MGNSAIVSEKAVRSALTEEEIAGLKTGMILLDI
jgi:C4-type Zn-finger protein